MIYIPDDNIYVDVLVFVIFITLFRFYILPLRYLPYLILFCLDISILLIFLVFCRSVFIINRKSNVDNISKFSLAVYHNQLSSPDSPDSKSSSFRTHA